MMERLDHKDLQMTVRAETVIKVLGKSNLTLLDILIRESIQNSLDASLSSTKGFINFYIDVIDLGNHATLIDKIDFLRQKDDGDHLFTRLANRIRQNEPAVLLLRDTGTTGLSGPVRRDNKEWNTSNERKNFESLVYQLGQSHGAVISGGTYGFGKSVYYLTSTSGLVMFYSRSKEGERLAFNLVSKDEQQATKGSTGIAWWGETYTYDGNQYSAPITNEESILQIFGKLGMQDYRLPVNTFGTMIGIIAPNLDRLIDLPENGNKQNGNHRSKLDDFIYQLQETSLRWYWPRMTITTEINPNGKCKPLQIIIDGKSINIPPHYSAMGNLLKAAECNNKSTPCDTANITIKGISHTYGGNPLLGTLAFTIIDNPSLGLTHLNRIAMIRSPRMVVSEIPVQFDDKKSVAALFLLNSLQEVWPNSEGYQQNKDRILLDSAFRDCESATHSEWNYQSLPPEKNWIKSYVKQVHNKCKEYIQGALRPLVENTTENQYSEEAKFIGKILLSEDIGFVRPFKSGTTERKGSKINPEKTKIEVLEQKFIKNGNIWFKLKCLNMTNGEYEIRILAVGHKDSRDIIEWKEDLGSDFPFIIEEVNCHQVPVSIVNEGIFSFTIIEATMVMFSLIVKPVKLDALIGFEIRKK